MSEARREARGARFDAAIDRAVREMLDVEPPVDLRAKVIARIEERPASSFRLPAFSFQRFAAVAGTVAIVALILTLALTLTLTPTRVPQPPVNAHAGDHRLPVPSNPQSIDTPSAPRAQAATGTNPNRRAPAAVIQAASNDAADAAPGIDPLKAIAPIEVAPIAQSSIAPEPIDVRPLNPITDVQIAPLNPPDRRD